MGMKEGCALSHKSYATSVYTYSYGGAKPTHINAPTILTQTHAHWGMKWREKGKSLYFIIGRLGSRKLVDGESFKMFFS